MWSGSGRFALVVVCFFGGGAMAKKAEQAVWKCWQEVALLETQLVAARARLALASRQYRQATGGRDYISAQCAAILEDQDAAVRSFKQCVLSLRSVVFQAVCVVNQDVSTFTLGQARAMFETRTNLQCLRLSKRKCRQILNRKKALIKFPMLCLTHV